MMKNLQEINEKLQLLYQVAKSDQYSLFGEPVPIHATTRTSKKTGAISNVLAHQRMMQKREPESLTIPGLEYHDETGAEKKYRELMLARERDAEEAELKERETELEKKRKNKKMMKQNQMSFMEYDVHNMTHKKGQEKQGSFDLAAYMEKGGLCNVSGLYKAMSHHYQTLILTID